MDEQSNQNEEQYEAKIEADQFADELLELISEDPNLKNIEQAKVLRVEEKRSKGWNGVRGCCDQGTVNAQANAIYESFLKEKIYQYRHMRYIRSGHGGGTPSCRNRTEPWPSNARSCTGSLELTCWVEFLPR